MGFVGVDNGEGIECRTCFIGIVAGECSGNLGGSFCEGSYCAVSSYSCDCRVLRIVGNSEVIGIRECREIVCSTDVGGKFLGSEGKTAFFASIYRTSEFVSDFDFLNIDCITVCSETKE